MKKSKPDEYFNNGMFEMARFGKSTYMRNIMSDTQYKQYIDTLKGEFGNRKNEINELIQSICDKVCKCNPIDLLTFASDSFLLSMINVQSELHSDFEASLCARMTEYVQSILVSLPNHYIDFQEKVVDNTETFLSIQADIEKLYKLVYQFYLPWGLKLRDEHPEWDESTIDTAIESQTLYLVRGQKYYVFEVEFLKYLLKIHNDEFLKLFDLNVDNIFDGFEKLQYALSNGKLDSFKALDVLLEEQAEENLDSYHLDVEQERQARKLVDEFIGTGLRDVIKVTGWTEKFVDALSYGLNENQDFFGCNDYSGWPVLDLPIQKRPFIKIGKQFFCFDYYSFVDNFYRVIQKTFARLDSTYDWNGRQKEASETMVENVFEQMLPGCTVYRNNYYKIGKNNFAENDLIIIYYGILLVVEIKAGSFIYTSPLIDFENHIKSYKALIETPDKQCKRTYDYLVSQSNATLYDEEHSLKTQIDMGSINDIFMLSITIDNINDFAARANKLSFLNIMCNAISISIDDLMVYREYFDTPLEFLHFLKQRRAATQVSGLALNDELDHLGMYIEHNCYPLTFENMAPDTLNTFLGYREKLDIYFSSLIHPELGIQKPKQERAKLFYEIISYLHSSNLNNKVELSDYILSFSSEAEQQFNNNVLRVFERQCEIKHMIVSNSAGCNDNLRFTCYIHQPNISSFSEKEKRDYALSSLLWNGEQDRIVLELWFDKNRKFQRISMRKYAREDITDDEIEILQELGKQRADRLIDVYKMSSGNKIGRNDLCPCGSGRKYKKCCGKC